MKNEDSEFSSLRTVTSFDRGDNCTLAVGVNSQEIQSFSPSSLLVESLIDQLCKLLEKDPDNQKKLYLTVCEKLREMNLIGQSYEREEFQFMRSHYQKALYSLLTIAKATTSVENKVLFPKRSNQLYFSCGGVLEWSRYSTEFKELEYIAKGGFGHVYKAQHKLDGEIYAVKKIALRYNSVNDFLQYLKEVKMLAKLNHVNIVAYKAAWLEPMEGRVSSKKDKEGNLPAICNLDTSNSESIEAEGNDDSLEVVFEGSEKSVSIIEESQSISCSTSNCSALVPVSCQKKVFQFNYFEENYCKPVQCATLYIQMQLCKRTLRFWLDERNYTINNSEIDLHQCLEIFRKIVKGVEYIHSQRIVHHDIKPSNIFVSEDLSEVQVGDFGLACSLLAHPQTSLSIIATHPRGQIGTKLYAAPEQLNGKCDPKSDVYSLGILLLELLVPFNTTMERAEIITRLRAGHLPAQLEIKYPNEASIIKKTVSSLEKRPTSTELLKKLDEFHTNETTKLVVEQRKLIKKLRRESQAKDEEIAFLKNQLALLLSKKNGVSPS